MLHPIPDSTARAQLEQVKQLQEALFLALVALPDGHTWPDNTAVADWIQGLQHWSELSQTVVRNRFGRTNSKWSACAIVIAGAPTATKVEMQRVWNNHSQVRALYVDGSTAALEMLDWEASPEWENLWDLMSSFYDEALGGGDFSLAADGVIHGAGYRSGYTTLRVCPYWDCGLVPTEIELDHFLPRSAFPFLSVDPDNLVPVSHGPNRAGHKGSKIALDDRPAGQSRPAHEWFHPRWRSAETHLDVRVTRASGAALTVRLASTTPQFVRHVENLDQLLDLAANWTQEANRTFQSDQTDIGSEMKVHAPHATFEIVVAGRIQNFANRRTPREFALLNQRKFECYLADQATREEILRQVIELGIPLRPN